MFLLVLLLLLLFVDVDMFAVFVSLLSSPKAARSPHSSPRRPLPLGFAIVPPKPPEGLSVSLLSPRRSAFSLLFLSGHFELRMPEYALPFLSLNKIATDPIIAFETQLHKPYHHLPDA